MKRVCDCPTCGEPAAYSDQVDAWFCVKCDEWLEVKCDGPECGYCPTRPDKPSEVK